MPWQLVGKGAELLCRADAQRPPRCDDLQCSTGVDVGRLIACAMELSDSPERAEAPARSWISEVVTQHGVKVHCLGDADVLVRLIVLYCHNLWPSPGGFLSFPCHHGWTKTYCRPGAASLMGTRSRVQLPGWRAQGRTYSARSWVSRSTEIRYTRVRFAALEKMLEFKILRFDTDVLS